jgi:AcrR family transcriptional regulator
MATRLQRKKAVTELRRRQVLDAALAVFSRKGYGEATIPDIAREGGMSVGTIYNYYASKREILVAVLAGRVLSEPFLKLLEQSTVTDDRQYLRSLLEDRLTLLTESSDKFLFMLSEIGRDQELRRQWAREVLQVFLRQTERHVASRIGSGAFRPMDARVTARALAGMVIGFAVLAMIEGEDSPCRDTPAGDLAAQMAEIALTGIQAAPGNAPGKPGP